MKLTRIFPVINCFVKRALVVNQKCLLLFLPPQVLSHLTVKERCLCASLVCKYWRDLCLDFQFWKQIDLSGLQQVRDVTLWSWSLNFVKILLPAVVFLVSVYLKKFSNSIWYEYACKNYARSDFYVISFRLTTISLWKLLLEGRMWRRSTSRIAGGCTIMVCPPWPHAVQACKSTQPTGASSWETSPCPLWPHTALSWSRCMLETRINWQMHHWRRYFFQASLRMCYDWQQEHTDTAQGRNKCKEYLVNVFNIRQTQLMVSFTCLCFL